MNLVKSNSNLMPVATNGLGTSLSSIFRTYTQINMDKSPSDEKGNFLTADIPRNNSSFLNVDIATLEYSPSNKDLADAQLHHILSDAMFKPPRRRILFSDEAHFWLNGYVNKQNCRIWSEANPQVYVETQLQPEKLTVWCALWAGGIIGPYFFKSDEGHNVTVNGDRYRAMITNFFIPELNNHDVQELWFQQDGATCHTARATIDLLKDTFGDRLISRFGPVNWSPRSWDLTPLDYFLWAM
ncbi:putative transposable element [Trichonephila clavipes]|nr:putative transposable element [Trichonephila clavipes]